MKLHAEWPGGAASTPLTAGVPVFPQKQIFPVRVKDAVFSSGESFVLLQQLCLYLQTKCLFFQNVTLVSVSVRENGVGTMVKYASYLPKVGLPRAGSKTSLPKANMRSF